MRQLPSMQKRQRIHLMLSQMKHRGSGIAKSQNATNLLIHRQLVRSVEKMVMKIKMPHLIFAFIIQYVYLPSRAVCNERCLYVT